MKVKLIASTIEPVDVIFQAFRTCYSKEDSFVLFEKIKTGEITEEEKTTFINRMLKTGHTSTLRHVSFTFIVDEVSRAMTAQLNRHSVGIAISEVSQRYVDFSKGLKNFIMPDSFKGRDMMVAGGRPGDWPDNISVEQAWTNLISKVEEFYSGALEAGVPKEDARFALPMATTSREIVSFTFEALQHFIDLRTCHRAQWEIASVANLMMREIKKFDPVLGAKLGCKCTEGRKGFCDEDFNEYQKCPRSKIRPHQTHIEEWTKEWKRNK